jgi:hypothetical protein
MNINDIKIPAISVATLIVFVVGSSFTIDFRYAKAEDIKQFQYQQAIRDDRQWLEILEEKLKDAKTTEEREKIKRQIERTEQSLYINMGKIK